MTNTIEYNTILSFYRGKTVLLTGHSGFKGTWLAKILLDAGAKVIGYSLQPPTSPSLMNILGYDNPSAKPAELVNVFADIRDFDTLKKTFETYKPDIVLHLAAQPIVRESYKEPRYTYETNVMGTVNICECIRLSLDTDHPVQSFLNVTTDKVYHNNEWSWGYRENEPLDGFDPYSNSKSCSELVTHSYINSFFKDADSWKIPASTARAGNVIGGGDFASDRIIPDCVRAVQSSQPLVIRNPNSTRPYQHVLEPLFTYLTIAAEQCEHHDLAGFYNVGPDDCDCVTTGELVELFDKFYNTEKNKTGKKFTAQINHDPNAPHEANFLKLDTSLVKTTFGWKPTWHINEAIRYTVEWTKVWLDALAASGTAEDGKIYTADVAKAVDEVMAKQIEEFVEK